MSQVLEEVVNQEEFTKLEMKFDAQDHAATQAEDAILRAEVTATVKAHRLGTAANKLQPLVEARGDNWEEYLRTRRKALRSVQRGQLIAAWGGDEETLSTMRVGDAKELALETPPSHAAM